MWLSNCKAGTHLKMKMENWAGFNKLWIHKELIEFDRIS